MSRIIFNYRPALARIERNMEDRKTDVSNELFKEIKQRSPVRSGLFKRSWAKRKNGDNIRIVNSQPYGPALENGRSKQAPNGVVGPARRNLR
jgi:hypothetical protein